MDAPNLDSLTSELFEKIIQYLPLSSIRNIRLVNRSTASKAFQETYRSYFRNKHVEIRRETLQSFVKATSHGGVGCLVEHLSLIGIVYDPKDLEISIKTCRPPRKMGSSRKTEREYSPRELEGIKQDLQDLKRRWEDDKSLWEEGEDVISLREAFSNLALCSKREGTAGLKSLSLLVKIHRGDTVKSQPRSLRCSRQLFRIGTRTFRLAMESLRSSGLKVQELDVFFNWPEKLECSLPCDEMGKLDLTGKLKDCLPTLKNLSVSITDPMVAETDYQTRAADEGEDDVVIPGAERCTSEIILSRDKIANEKHYAALSEILELCPRLEELNIVGYRLDCSDEELNGLQKTMRSRYMHHLARATPLPRLRKLCLASLEVQDTDFYIFIRSHLPSLRELDLIDIAIPEGSFPSVASYITGGETGFEAIRFRDIREGKELIHFRCDWEGDGVYRLDGDVVTMWGIERKGNIDYFSKELGLLGSPTGWEWTLAGNFREEEEEDIGAVLPLDMR